MDNLLMSEAKATANFLRSVFRAEIPDTVVILGSGLGSFTEIVEVIETVKYSDIPNFPQSHVAGHKGNLSIADVGDNRRVLLMEGRFHYYEGYTAKEVVFPIVVFHLLGIRNLFVSNAAGGINPNLQVGDLMLINDHINLTGTSPLIGRNNEEYGPRFLDQTEPYNRDLIDHAILVANSLDIYLQQGTYLGVSGPTYESKAEICAFAVLGADAVGMSTIFEVIMANYFKMRVLGISCITNMATGIAKVKHSHEEIITRSREVSDKFSRLVKQILLMMPQIIND